MLAPTSHMAEMEFIKKLHRELQAAFVGTQILLGGSYWSGEADAESDIDFYCLCSWRFFFGYKKAAEKNKLIRQKFPEANYAIILVPNFFFRRGWLYAVGITEEGNVRQSKSNRKLIFRNALKLGWYNYFLYARYGFKKYLEKSRHQAAIAERTSLAAELKPSDLQKSNLSIPDWSAEQIPGLLTQMETQHQKLLHFSLVNWLIYNTKFLVRGNPLFFFANPDKLILRKINQSKNNGGPEFIAWLKKYVFPVIII